MSPPAESVHAKATATKATQPAGAPAVDRMVIYLFGRRPEWAAFTKGFVPA